MKEDAYDKMVRYAQSCLPKSAFLEAAEIVNDAYLNVGGDDSDTLRKEIKRLTHKQKGATSGFVSLDKAHFKDWSLVETSQVCKRCGREKSIDDFGKTYRTNSPVFHRRQTCMVCCNKRDRAKLKADPVRLERNNETAKKNYWLRHPNGWALTIERIKDQLSTCDWSILEKKLAENNLLPEVVIGKLVSKPTKQWTHKEIILLEEYAERMTIEQLSRKLSRPCQDIQNMIKGLGITHLATR